MNAIKFPSRNRGVVRIHVYLVTTAATDDTEARVSSDVVRSSTRNDRSTRVLGNDVSKSSTNRPRDGQVFDSAVVAAGNGPGLRPFLDEIHRSTANERTSGVRLNDVPSPAAYRGTRRFRAIVFTGTDRRRLRGISDSIVNAPGNRGVRGIGFNHVRHAAADRRKLRSVRNLVAGSSRNCRILAVGFDGVRRAAADCGVKGVDGVPVAAANRRFMAVASNH